MPTKKPPSLPPSLGYLQPFVNVLTKLPPSELNEDVDSSKLNTALRKRIRGLDAEAATLNLDADRKQLQSWLEPHADHPAHWILGFLLLPDLAVHLSEPSEPVNPGPTITFELPDGCKRACLFPFRLDFKRGKVHGSIAALEASNFENLRQSREQPPIQVSIPGLWQPRIEQERESIDVVFGACYGRKYVSRTIAPVAWKQVDYMLHVPGGCVSVWLGTLTGVDFDEMPVEKKLHTVALSASA